MAKSSVAREVLIPDDSRILRVVFLYTGQGEATLLVVPDAGTRKLVLVDCNSDGDLGGVDLARMFKDLDMPIDVFINTHPHADHLDGIKDVFEVADIREVWHSGHVPGKLHKEAYEQLQHLMNEVGQDNVTELRGSREEFTLGDITYSVLAPADYVKDEIEDEDAETRYRRIHEQCAVLKFCYMSSAVLITGDSDLAAWRDHITQYHGQRLKSDVLSASHHGSRTFFKADEKADPFLQHMDAIDCSYVVISAPKQSDSPHNHPHDDAVSLYAGYVTEEGIMHLGKHRECVIVDIGPSEGDFQVRSDKRLTEAYGQGQNDGSMLRPPGLALTTLDRKPMG